MFGGINSIAAQHLVCTITMPTSMIIHRLDRHQLVEDKHRPVQVDHHLVADPVLEVVAHQLAVFQEQDQLAQLDPRDQLQVIQVLVSVVVLLAQLLVVIHRRHLADHQVLIHHQHCRVLHQVSVVDLLVIRPLNVLAVFHQHLMPRHLLENISHHDDRKTSIHNVCKHSICM